MHPEAVAVGAERSCLAAVMAAFGRSRGVLDTAVLARQLAHEVWFFNGGLCSTN
jgi:hypothetical protein